MANQTKEDLQKIEKAMVKLRNKAKRSDLDYTVQISISSADPQVVRYAAQMTPPAEGLAPVTFIEHDTESLVNKIKLATKGINYEEIEKAYHSAQIDAAKRTIAHHEDRVYRIENPEEEETVEQLTEVEGEPSGEAEVSAESEVEAKS